MDSASVVRRFLPLSLSALALLGIAGCSSDSSESSDSSTTIPAPDSDIARIEEPESEHPEPAAASTPEPKSDKQATPPSKPAVKKVVDPTATGSFSGKIVLDGDAPVLEPLTKASDANLKDKEVCGKVDISNESVIVGDGNGIANVFVYLRRAPKGYKSEVPAEPVVLDQKGCVFTPHVALIQAGQKVLVKSSDNVQHNVHTFPARNQSTNLLINPNEQTGIDLTYNKAESDPLQVKCDIHSWMVSYHLVLDHPFMAVTDANGEFRIDGLPAGQYDFRIWHETGGLLNKGFEATVTGEDEPVELKFPADKFAG